MKFNITPEESHKLIIEYFESKKGKRLSPHFYLFKSLYPRRKNFNVGFNKLIKDLKIKAIVQPSMTRYEYDDSDYTAWILFYGEDKEKLKEDTNKLQNIQFNNQGVFNVSGNGWGTGLVVMLNYNKIYK